MRIGIWLMKKHGKSVHSMTTCPDAQRRMSQLCHGKLWWNHTPKHWFGYTFAPCTTVLPMLYSTAGVGQGVAGICLFYRDRRSNYWWARVAPKTHPSHISPIDPYSSIDLDRKTWRIVKTRWTSKGFLWFLSFSSELRGRLWIQQITNQMSSDLTKRDRRLEKIEDPGMYSDMLRKSVKHKIAWFHHTYQGILGSLWSQQRLKSSALKHLWRCEKLVGDFSSWIAGSRPRVSPPWSWIPWILWILWILWHWSMPGIGGPPESPLSENFIGPEMPFHMAWGTKKLKMNLAEWLANAIWSSTQPLWCEVGWLVALMLGAGRFIFKASGPQWERHSSKKFGKHQGCVGFFLEAWRDFHWPFMAPGVNQTSAESNGFVKASKSSRLLMISVMPISELREIAKLHLGNVISLEYEQILTLFFFGCWNTVS